MATVWVRARGTRALSTIKIWAPRMMNELRVKPGLQRMNYQLQYLSQQRNCDDRAKARNISNSNSVLNGFPYSPPELPLLFRGRNRSTTLFSYSNLK